MTHEPTAATDDAGGVSVELPLGGAAPDFNLEKAVCSHGLFMTAPNQWDERSKTLTRPLRLDDESSFIVHITHRDNALHLRVLGTRYLTPQHHRSLQTQVRRMLRLSEEENKRVKEFHEMHDEAKGRGFGRVFRSPTLFEDMVKCILLCNCQWSRTLSMAEALCELQFELQHSLSVSSTEGGAISGHQATESKYFAPRTPAKKESKKRSRKGIAKVPEPSEETWEANPDTDNLHLQLRVARIGNFPSSRELARVDEKFLASRCNLGYRAGRVINLARGIVQGSIQLNEFEDACDGTSLSNYNTLFERLRVIDGFGPFTCANVLMCMGFYHAIPTDSETIRHLKQVHGKHSKLQTVEEDLEKIYGKYAPFQFLAYWSEVWQFYEEWFGNLSEMPRSNYRLITAANMKPRKLKQTAIKKTKQP